MGFLKNVIKKMKESMTYVVDAETLKGYLQNELHFSLTEGLEASANAYIYVNGERHHIQIWNFTASDREKERVKGVIFYYDDFEYKTLDDLFNTHCRSIVGYFKIKLIDYDNEYLNNYKKKHPELKVEDYD